MKAVITTTIYVLLGVLVGDPPLTMVELGTLFLISDLFWRL